MDYANATIVEFIVDLASVVKKADSTIQWIVQLVSLILIYWIEIYPMDSAIQLLNNWGLKVLFHG